MTSALEVIEPGAANTVQDLGRAGHRAIGVPVGGAADRVLMACVNRLLGNDDGDAVIEMPLAGPTLKIVEGPLSLALVGDVQGHVQRASGSHAVLSSHHTITLQPGDVLRVASVRRGIAYLGARGGMQVPLQLGSRSTYARASLGGVDGRALKAGDRLPVGGAAYAIDEGPASKRAPALEPPHGPIRVLLGPQDDAFTSEGLASLLSGVFRVSREADRMGIRLEGPKLQHRTGADLCSEGVVPGSIQVPGNGEPIVLLADAQTVGGYTKIATVIRADLPRLAHARPGDELRFVAVTREQALQAWTQLHAALDAWTRSIEPYQPPGHLDLERLYDSNLLSGMIDARRETLPWEPLP